MDCLCNQQIFLLAYMRFCREDGNNVGVRWEEEQVWLCVHIYVHVHNIMLRVCVLRGDLRDKEETKRREGEREGG